MKRIAASQGGWPGEAAASVKSVTDQGNEAAAEESAAGAAGIPRVVDADGLRTLQFDELVIQSQMDLHDPDRLAVDYTRTMMGFLLFRPAPDHIAMIGLGGGSLAKYCLRTLPAARFTAVEIDPAVIALRDEFGIPPDGPRLAVLRADGAEYVREAADSPDVLLVDGFDAGGQPPDLCSPAFYADCRAMLADGGVLVVNLWAGDSRYGVYASRIRTAFDGRMVAVASEDGSNRIVFAGKDASFPPPRRILLERARELAATHPLGFCELAQRIVRRLDRAGGRERELHALADAGLPPS